MPFVINSHIDIVFCKIKNLYGYKIHISWSKNKVYVKSVGPKYTNALAVLYAGQDVNSFLLNLNYTN